MLNKRYKYFNGNKDKEFYISSMKKYLNKKQEIDKFFEGKIKQFLLKPNLKILDACCGIGHLLYYLSDLSPQSSFIGIDNTSYLINEAKKRCKNKKNVSFELGDIYDLPSKYPKNFDITINWKTLSWLPYYDEIMKSLISITKKHIFLSSLFYDGEIDFEIKVREFKKEGGNSGFNQYYNVYSLPQFQKFVYNLGVKNIESYNFEIGIDIPKPPVDQMGTYTIKLENGKRLQISGAIIMFWKIIRIDL